MNQDTLIQRGNPGYSKQQKQLREASRAPAPTAPATAQDTQVATTIGDSSYNAGGGKINPYNQPITSAAMAPAPAVVLPTPTTPTTTAPVEAAVNASTANVTKANDAAAANAEQATAPTQSDNLAKTMRDVLGIQDQIATETASIDRTAQDKARIEADQYTSQIEQEALAARRATDALQKNNPQGLFGGALQDEVNRINRDSLSKQADLAILQNSALRNFDTAKSIADRQLELKLEPLKTKLENLKFFYGENKEILSKADDRAYNELIKAKDREYNKIEATETQLNEIKKNVAQYAGADAANIINQLSKIDSKSPDAVSKALTLAGKYQSDPLDRAIKNAQLSKLNADVAKTRSDARLADTTAVSSEAQSWATAISSGKAKLSDVPKNLKTSVAAALATGSPNKEVLNTLNDKLAIIDEITSNTGFFGGLRKTVGPNALARKGYLSFNNLTGKDQDFVAAVNQLVSQETLTTLLDLKKAGGTLGALNKDEGDILKQSATKINSWKKEDADGNVYYRASEASFIKEINTLKKYTERAIKEAGGVVPTTKSQTSPEDDYFATSSQALVESDNPFIQR